MPRVKPEASVSSTPSASASGMSLRSKSVATAIDARARSGQKREPSRATAGGSTKWSSAGTGNSVSLAQRPCSSKRVGWSSPGEESTIRSTRSGWSATYSAASCPP